MATQPVFHQSQLHPQTATRQRARWQKVGNQVSNFLTEYWAHILTAALGLLVGTAIAVPFLSYLGLDAIAKPIFFTLHLVCAQIPSHSFYIFGHQLGLCARNFSIYTSMFLGCLVFVLSKKRIPGIPWWAWLLMMLPMAWDGLTQMFGLRESDWILRVITGTLFGLGNVWFVLPLMQKALLETTLPLYVQQELKQHKQPMQSLPQLPAQQAR
jgi:uncharacterized membrane protein